MNQKIRDLGIDFLKGLRSLTGIKKIKVPIGKKYKVYLDSIFVFHGFKNWGNKHNNGFFALLNLSKNNQVIYDVGAQIGLCTIPLAVKNKQSEIHAFEPSNINYTYLKRHVKYNKLKNCVLNQVLVGDAAKKNVEFYEAKSMVTGISSMINVDNNILKKSYYDQITLDAYAKKHKHKPDLIKIDVEGAEIAVLEGAKKIITSAKPTIVLSVHPKHIVQMGYSLKDIDSLLEELKYTITNTDGSTPRSYELKEYILRPK